MMSSRQPGFSISDRADGAVFLRWQTLEKQILGVQGEMNFGYCNN